MPAFPIRSAATVLFVLSIPGFAQMSPFPGSSPGGGRRGDGLPSPVPDISGQKDKDKRSGTLPSFDGKVKALDGKTLLLERPDQHTLELRCSKKTKYYSGSKKIKASDLKPGDRVSVDTRRAPDGELDAVNVWLQHQKTS